MRHLLVRLERRLGRLRVDARKQDTRNKIQLGGLVIKAGLEDEDTAVLLGAFLSIAAELASFEGAAVRRRYRRVGDQEFTKDEGGEANLGRERR